MTTETSPLALIREIAGLIDEHKGMDISVYDIREVSNISEYLIVASAYNRRHISALHEELKHFMKKQDVGLIGAEGLDDGNWALFDYGRFVVHLFRPEIREFYDLELIWGDAPAVDWQGGL